MQATIIKLDRTLVSTIRKLKCHEQSLIGFVRQLILREEKNRAMESAAADYTALLARSSDEVAWLASWESAALASAPKLRNHRRRGLCDQKSR